MASQTVSHLLGTLERDPDNEDALTQIAELSNNGAGTLGAEDRPLLERARQTHESRGEFRALAELLELEARLTENDPDRVAGLLRELGRIYREELLDDDRARAACERARQLRPGDAEIQSALDRLEETRERWRDIADRFLDEVKNASDASLKCGLYVSAASLLWKYDRSGSADEVHELFQKALAAAPGDARAVRLTARILREDGRDQELAGVLLRASEEARGREEKVNFALGAARVLSRRLGDGHRSAEAYGRVLDFVPGQPEAMAFLVKHFTDEQDWDHLVALYEDQLRSRRKIEDEQGALLNLGMVHWRFRASPQEAEPYFARLRKMEPAHPGMLTFYRETLGAGQEPRWLGILADAQRMAPTDERKLELALELAHAAEGDHGNTERAIDAWKAVLRLDRSRDDAPRALKDLYRRTQKWNALVELLKSEAAAVPLDQTERKVALLRELVPIYRERLNLDVMVIQTFNQILELAPADPEALDALAETYESTGRWNDLIQVLTRQAESEEDPERKVALYIRVARLWVDRFANYNQAAKPLEEVIGLQPDNRRALSQLEDIYRKKRAWQRLFDVLKRQAELEEDPEAHRALRLELAKLAGDRLHDHKTAITLWKGLLEEDRERRDALDALEMLAEREKDWTTLAQVLEIRVGRAEDGRQRTKLLQKLGAIYGDHLDEPTRAAGAWKRILDLDPKNGRALRTLRETFLRAGDWPGLEALYADAEDWEGLVDVLGNAAERVSDKATKIQLSFRAAEVYEERLGQPHRAFRSYERVLAEDPENSRAARALIPLYERDEKWSRLPALYEVLYRNLEDGVGTGERLELLGRLQTLAAERLRDLDGAFRYAARAFDLEPTSTEVRHGLEQSAERARRHEELIKIYLGRLDAIEDEEDAEAERLWLRRRVAQLAHGSLGQTEQAVEQLKGILVSEPGDRAAADALEQIYRLSDQHRELRGLLLHRVSHADDDRERRERLLDLARLEEEVLGDPASAAARFRRMLEIDAHDVEALEALDRLTAAEERWDEHADILERRRVMAPDADQARAILLRLGDARLTHLDDPAGALTAFGAALEEDDSPEAIQGLETVAGRGGELAEEANLLLEGAYERAGAWEKLARVLTARLAHVESPSERRALRLRYADLAVGRIGDPLGAYRALEGALLDEPGDPALWDRLVEAADAAGAHQELAKAFATALEADGLGDLERADLASRVAQLYDVVLGQPREAEPFHRRVLHQDPLDERSFLALKELYTNEERWNELQVLYRNRIAETVDPEARLDLLLQVCFLFEELIDDPTLAIQAYQDVLELSPDHQASRRALERLYERTERWRDLVALLRMELEQADEAEQVGLTHRLGSLHERRLDEPAVAVDHYEQVLDLEPNHKFAREALERLIHHPAQRQRVARTLEPVYEDRGDWAELVRVLEVQLEDLVERGSRVDLLGRIAELEENRLHDPTAAFRTMARSVDADPADERVREELARLAAMRGAQRERAAVLEEAIEGSAGSPGLNGELLLELARLWDDEVGDAAEAEKAFRRLIAVEGDNPGVVLEASRALERIHVGQGNHEALAADLRRQVKFETDPDVRRELLVRLGDLLERSLGDRAGAIVAHQERLDLDPADADALLALERLYEQQGEWQRLIGILHQRDGVEDDAERQKAIARRIGVIYETRLDDPDNAIVAYNEVLGRFGTDRETLDALGRLYEHAQKWEDLLEVAEMVYDLAEHSDERAAIRFQMAELMRTRTGELERAIEAYSEVLDLVPDHAETLESLALIMAADGRAPAASADLGAPAAEEAAHAAPQATEGALPALPELPRDEGEPPAEVVGDAAAAGEARAEPETGADGEARAEGEARADGEARAEGEGSGEAVAAPSADASVPSAAEPAADRWHPAEPPAPEPPLEYPLHVRVEAARVLRPRYEATAAYPELLVALGVLAESDDPIERFRALRRAAEVADVGLEDPSRAFPLLGRALRAGLGEEDLALMLDDLSRLAAESARWQEYVELLRDVAPDILDGELQVETHLQVADVARSRLGDGGLARRTYERVLELAPDNRVALDALEALTAEAGDDEALLEVLRRKTELADAPEERVALLLRRAELSEERLEDLPGAIDGYEQALSEAQPRQAYLGLERLYAASRRYHELALHYERMLDEGVGSPVEVRYQLGAVQLEHLDDPWAAVDHFRAALTLDPSHQPTIEALERLMETEDHRAAAAQILEPVFLQAMDWPKVTTCLEARIAAEADIEERKALLVRLGQMHEDYLEDLEGAMEAYARLFAEDPRDEDTWETLSRLARVLEKWERLAGIYEDGLDAITIDDPQTARLAFTTGQLNDRLARPDRAAALYDRALRFDPTDPAAFEALEDAHRRRMAWEELLELYRRQADAAPTDDERVELLRKSARLLEQQLGRPSEGIKAWRGLLTLAPADADGVDALDRLLMVEERWAELADHIRHQVDLYAGEPEELDLKHRLASVLATKLDDTPSAIDLYEEITQVDPGHTETVAALERLVQDADHQARIIEILEPIYLATDQWRKRIAIYEAQGKRSDHPGDRVRLLGQIAELHETRGHDLALAFHAWARALSADPEDEEVRGHVDRLAETLGTWDAHITAYEDALARADEPSVQASLLATMAKVHDERRGDPRAAIETYERLLEVDPDDPAPLDALEALHTMVGDWRGLADVLDRKVERTFDPAERADLHIRAGSVVEELLNDASGAIESYRKALGEDPDSGVALESLDRLYARSGEHQALAEILERRVQLDDDPQDRTELGLRLGALLDRDLRRPDEAIEAYRRVLEDDPDHPRAVVALAELYERQGLWHDLLDNLQRQAERAEGAERTALLSRTGEVLERELGEPAEAMALYESVLATDPAHGPAIDALLRIAGREDYRAQASEILEPLLRSQGRWDELAELLAGKAAAVLDPIDRRVELRRLAEVHEEGRGDLPAALEALKAALAEDPEDVATADDLERVAERLGAWDQAADAFASRASSVMDPAVARALYGRLARIAEERLGDDARAVEAHARTLEQVGDDPGALAALDRLHLKMQAWGELADVLERRVEASMEPSERAGLLLRLGTLRRDRFDDRAGALRAFQEVLEHDPAQADAVAGVEALLRDDALAPEAVETLDRVYRQTGATDRVAALYDARIRLAAAPGEKVQLLQEQAATYEQDLMDPGRALEATLAAFVLDPADGSLVEDLERLAAAADRWDLLQGAVERVFEAEEVDAGLARDLNLRAATWYAGPLDDPGRAEARLRAAIEADPYAGEAHQELVGLLRAQGREADLVDALGRWAEVDDSDGAKVDRLREAAQLAEHALGDRERARRSYRALLGIDPTDEDALDQLIRLAELADEHAEVAELLVRRIEGSMDPAERLELRKRYARTLAGPLEDADGAQDAWRNALDEEPTDLEAIDALEALYERRERWSDLEDLIHRRLDLAVSSGERIAARVRLARLAEQRFGRREEAIEQLQEILDDDPANAEAMDELERLYAVGEDWPALVDLLEARAEAAAAAGDGPRELEVLLRLGAVHLERLDDAGRAAEIYGRILERDPLHAGVLDALVTLHLDREAWPEAVDALERRAEAQEPVDAIATLYQVAELAAQRVGDPARAEEALRRAYAMDPASHETRDRLKAHYEEHAQADRLAELLVHDEEEEQDPSRKVDLLKRIADLYAGPLADPGSAAAYLERACALVPEDRGVLLPLCDFYIAAGRQQDAIPVLEQIIASYGTRRNKEVAVYHHRLGRAKESMGDLDGALEAYDAAFRVDLTNVQVLTDLGRLCMNRGDLNRAQKVFKALLLQKLTADDGITKADVYFYLGDISAKLGDRRKAVSMLERAKAEDPSHLSASSLLDELRAAG
ncbi:MAG: hypothetical protein ACFCGT_08765 [Sandaracinaceae bacterium]